MLTDMKIDEEGLLDEPCLSCDNAYLEDIWNEWCCDKKECPYKVESEVEVINRPCVSNKVCEPDKKKVVDMLEKIDLPTVGEILKEEFMDPCGISAYRLAKDIFVPVSRIQEILNGTRRITVDTSIRLGKYFGVSYHYFVYIQNEIDIQRASEDMIDEINKIKEIKYVKQIDSMV